MTILDRLYASGGAEVIFNTLQINVGDRIFWLVENGEDVIATIESGQQVTFQATAMEVALPERNEDGTQDLTFAISNIEGVVSNEIRKAIENKSSGTLTFRRYISTDLLAPALPPFTLTIKEGSWSAATVQITAGFMNILDTAWPRLRYILSFFPGLRHIT